MKTDEYRLMYDIEKRYWWFTGKRFLVTRVLRRLAGRPGGFPVPARVLDIGCGTGGNMESLAEFGGVSGCDLAPEAVEFCRARGLTGAKLQESPGAFPFPDSSFDLATATDVLEHIDDDVAGLKEMARPLRPGGLLLLTVPAYPALWSVHDESVFHKRRYTRKDLKAKLEAAGLVPVLLTNWNLFLLPLIVPTRWLRDRVTRPSGATSDFHLELPKWMNALFYLVFVSEWLILRFLPLPAGLSLVAVVRKP
jgi:SAM-dependent methyltransferase